MDRKSFYQINLMHSCDVSSNIHYRFAIRHIDELVQNFRISIASALKKLQLCTSPSIGNTTRQDCHYQGPIYLHDLI